MTHIFILIFIWIPIFGENSLREDFAKLYMPRFVGFSGINVLTEFFWIGFRKGITVRYKASW